MDILKLYTSYSAHLVYNIFYSEHTPCWSYWSHWGLNCSNFINYMINTFLFNTSVSFKSIVNSPVFHSMLLYKLVLQLIINHHHQNFYFMSLHVYTKSFIILGIVDWQHIFFSTVADSSAIIVWIFSIVPELTNSYVFSMISSAPLIIGTTLIFITYSVFIFWVNS